MAVSFELFAVALLSFGCFLRADPDRRLEGGGWPDDVAPQCLVIVVGKV